MNSTQDLATHLAALNADRQYMTLVEDLDHWAEYGIHTPLQLDWYLSLSCVVDMHKDAYGFKGSWAAMPTTDAELRTQIDEMDKEIESLGEVIEAQIKADEEEATSRGAAEWATAEPEGVEWERWVDWESLAAAGVPGV